MTGNRRQRVEEGTVKHLFLSPFSSSVQQHSDPVFPRLSIHGLRRANPILWHWQAGVRRMLPACQIYSLDVGLPSQTRPVRVITVIFTGTIR